MSVRAGRLGAIAVLAMLALLGSGDAAAQGQSGSARDRVRVNLSQRTLAFGTLAWLHALLGRSTVSTTINTAFVERHNGTDRHQDSRKHRKTYGFSKELALYRVASFFIGYGYNFCWAVRTLRVRGEDGSWQARTPAMAAGLSDHVWSLREWVTCPAKPC